MLYEIANGERLTASDIGRALDLDAGYLCRVLRIFEKAGPDHPHDVRPGRATEPSGVDRGWAQDLRAIRAALAEPSRRHADRLKPAEQALLVAAMDSIETLLAARDAETG